MKTIRLRPKAEGEIERAAAYYARSDIETALRLYDAIDRALTLLAANPSMGARRYAHVLPGVELRFWPLKRFPYLIFYVSGPKTLDVLRFLHAHRDVPSALSEGH